MFHSRELCSLSLLALGFVLYTGVMVQSGLEAKRMPPIADLNLPLALLGSSLIVFAYCSFSEFKPIYADSFPTTTTLEEATFPIGFEKLRYRQYPTFTPPGSGSEK